MNETLQTHWSDCWREPGHHACAIRRIEQLEAELAKFRLDVVDHLFEPCVWRPVRIAPSDNDSSSPG